MKKLGIITNRQSRKYENNNEKNYTVYRIPFEFLISVNAYTCIARTSNRAP